MACYGMWPIGVKSRLVGLSAKFDPFSVAEFDSVLVEIPADTTLALQPISAQDKSFKFWGNKDLGLGTVTGNIQGDLCGSNDRHNVIICYTHFFGSVGMDLPSHASGYIFTGDAHITTNVD